MTPCAFPVATYNQGMTTKTATCPKCLGAKILRPFMHIDNGRCFMCAGAGVVEIRPSTTRRELSNFDLERARGEFRSSYRNIRSGAFTAAEVWEGWTGEDGQCWTPEAVIEVLEKIGARETFRALGWPV